MIGYSKVRIMSTQPAGLAMYPSWYARYLLAFNNQLRCRERVHDLRHRLISEEQRYLDQASDRVRDFVLAGKHTVRPVMGDHQTPRNQPAQSHPVAGKAMPKQLPSLRPQQGQAAPVDGGCNPFEIARYRQRRRKRKKARTLSPQYPTFCFEELVVRAEAETRREARKRGVFAGPVSSPVDVTTSVDNENSPEDAGGIPMPLTLMEYYLAPLNSQQTIGEVTTVRRSGPFEVNFPRNGLQQNSISPASLQTNLRHRRLRESEHVVMETEPRAPQASVEMHQVNSSRSRLDSNWSRLAHEHPPTVVSGPALNGSPRWEGNLRRFSKAPRDVDVRPERYFASEISPDGASMSTVGDRMESRNSRFDNPDSDVVIEYNDLLNPKESFQVEDGAPSIRQSPDETGRREKPHDDEQRKQRRKESHRKHLRRMNRVHGGTAVPHETKYLIDSRNDGGLKGTRYEQGGLRDHGNARPSNQTGHFPEIEAVRRWQLLGREGRHKINKSMRRYSHRDDHT